MTPTRTAKILLIEDTAEVRDLVIHALGEAYTVVVAAAKAEAMKLLETETFDLVILDVQLPDGDGFQLCAEIKSQNHGQGAPVIFLTAKSSIEDKILGFAVGADDYLVKPFDYRELLARVQAKLRNIDSLKRGKRIADLWIDFERQTAYICSGETPTPMDLTTTEFRLLSFLANNVGLVLNRERILDYVWGSGRYLGDRSVDVHISSLRRKMKGMRCQIKWNAPLQSNRFPSKF